MKETKKSPKLVVTFTIWDLPFTCESKEVSMASKDEALAKAKSLDGCVGYTFRQKGQPKKTLKRVLFGTAYTPEEIQRLNSNGKYDILLENITLNNYPRVIKTNYGFMPLLEGTEALSL